MTGPPPRIQPTHGELLDHADRTARYEMYNKPPLEPHTEIIILRMIENSTTPEHYLRAYAIAQLAGMCYWSNKEGDHIWRN